MPYFDTQIEVVLRSLGDGLLLLPFRGDQQEETRTGVRRPVIRGGKIAEEAAKHILYNPEGRIALPRRYWYGAYTKGGYHVTYKGKLLITSKTKGTKFFSVLRIREPWTPLYDGTPDVEPEWVPDVQAARADDGSARIKVRPLFPRWRTRFTFEFNSKRDVALETVHKLVEVTGVDVGVGSFRPGCQGGYGMFEIEQFNPSPIEE